MSMKRQQLLVELPPELQFQILVRLSAKSLLLCKCVCKTLRNFIQNPKFVQAHLARLTSSSNYNSQSLILQFTESYVFPDSYHYLLSADTKAKDWIFSLALNPPVPIVGKSLRAFIVGSCNGLILIDVMLCTYEDPPADYLLILWNPVLKQSRCLPKPHGDDKISSVYEFGFIPETNDYVVVKFRWKQQVIMVYKLSTDSWIGIDCSSYAEAKYFPRLYSNRKTVFLNGSFHWDVYSMNDIFYYNVQNEKIGLIKGLNEDRVLNMPEFYRNREGILKELTVVDESLAVIYWDPEVDYVFEIWVMNDYNVEDSWILRFRIVENSLDCKLIHPLGYWTDGLMIIAEQAKANYLDGVSTFVLYDVNTGSRLKIPGVERAWHITRFCSFMETLVPVRL